MKQMKVPISLKEVLSLLDIPKSIAVVGDIILDRYLEGEVNRISPEAPVPVVSGVTDTHVLGGAANVARNFSSLVGDKSSVSLYGVLGEDLVGHSVISLCEKNRIKYRGCFDPLKSTTLKTRVLGNGHQLLRIDHDLNSSGPITPSVLRKLGDSFSANSSDADLICFSDYGKGVLNFGCETLFKSSTKPRILSAMDPKKVDNIPKFLDILTPNRKELFYLSGIPDSGSLLRQACSDLWERFFPKILAVTLGGEGCAILEDGRFSQYSAFPQPVFDVSGAGDTWISVFSFFRCLELNSSIAAPLANLFSSISVSKMGTSCVTREDLDRNSHYFS